MSRLEPPLSYTTYVSEQEIQRRVGQGSGISTVTLISFQLPVNCLLSNPAISRVTQKAIP